MLKKRKAKQTEERNSSAPKVRHYDPHIIRHYITKQKLECQRKRREEKQKQLLAKECKEQRLQKLYAFQKRIFSNPTTVTTKIIPAENKDNIDASFIENTHSDVISSYEDKSSEIISSQKINLDQQTSSDRDISINEVNPNDYLENLSSENKLPIFADIITRNDGNLESEMNSAANSKTISSEKNFQDKLVPDERLTKLKAFASSIQNQIDFETERIKGLLFQKSMPQTSLSNISIHQTYEGLSKSDKHTTSVSFNRKLEEKYKIKENTFENYKTFPGVQNIYSHALEVMEKKKSLAAVKIQSVYRGYVARKIYKQMLKNISDNFNKTNESLSEGPLESEDDVKISESSSINETDEKEEQKRINKLQNNQIFENQIEIQPDNSLLPSDVESIHYSSDFMSIAEEISHHSDHNSIISASEKIELNSTNNSEIFQNSASKSSPTEKENMPVSSPPAISVHNESSGNDSIENKLLSELSEVHSEIIKNDADSVQTSSEDVSTTLSEGPLSSVQGSDKNYSEENYNEKHINNHFDCEKLSLSNIQNKSEDIQELISNESINISRKSTEKTIHSDLTESNNKSNKTESIQTISYLNNNSYENLISGNENKESRNDDDDSNTIKESIEEKSINMFSDNSFSVESTVSNIPVTSGGEKISEQQLDVRLSTLPKEIESEIPGIIGTCMSAELSCLESLNNSLLYLSDYGKLNELIHHQRDVVNFAHLLQLQGDKQQEQQQRMFQELLHHQENQARILEESRAEQKQLLQNTIAEAHAAISEKTLKIVEVQAHAVKSSADALLQFAEKHNIAKKEYSLDYSNDFEPLETNHHSSSMKNSTVSSQSDPQSSSSSISEELAILSDKQNENFSRNSNVDISSQNNENESSKQVIIQISKSSTKESIPESLKQEYTTDEHSQRSSVSCKSLQNLHTDQELINKSVQVPSVSHKTHFRNKSFSTISDMGSFYSVDQISHNIDHHNGELHSLVSNDSFTKFTLDMINQLAQEEKLRNRHQLARLELQEKELMEKTKAELACLELLKKKLRQKGALEKVSSVRKKQRALLLQLHQERAQLRWLQEIHRNSLRKISRREPKKALSKEIQSIPKSILTCPRPQESKSLRSSTTDSIPSEIEEKSIVDSDSHSDIPSEISPAYSSSGSTNKHVERSKVSNKSSNSQFSADVRTFHHTSHSLESLLKRFKKLENSKRYLTKREQKLLERRQEVENLLIWKQKLDAEENEIRVIEKKLFDMEKSQKFSTSSKSCHEDKKTSDDIKTEHSSKSLMQIDTEVSPGSSIDSQGNSKRGKSESESSIAEDVIPVSEYQNQTTSSNIQEEISNENKKQLSENEIYSESFETTNNSNIDSQQQNGMTPKEKFKRPNKKSPAMIRIPLIPHTHHRHDSSGSDDSFTVSQSETASDQSDIEGRILALSEELKRRQLEVSRLKKEQKKLYHEQLKERELSLQKQIEAYDQYIQKTKKELEQKTEKSGNWYASLETTPVKPQIKQPRVSESRRLRRNFANGDNLSPSSEVLKLSISSKLESAEVFTSERDKEISSSHSSILIAAEGKKSPVSHSPEENTSKIIYGESGDDSLTSTSLISTEISQEEISKISSKEDDDDDYTEKHIEFSEKSGLTQSEIKQTVIQENDDTEIDVEILAEEAKSSSSENNSKNTEIFTTISSENISKKEKTSKSSIDINDTPIKEDLSNKNDTDDSIKEKQRENLIDEITENIFQWLCTDTIETIKNQTFNQKQNLVDSNSFEEFFETENLNKSKPSEFISENLVDYLVEDSIDCMLQINKENKSISSICAKIPESENEKRNVTDISEKVTRILATLNDRKSIQSKSRPQDLMILSPLLDNIEDNNWEVTSDLEIEKTEVNSSFDSVLLNQKSDFLEESEWFDDDFGFGNKEIPLIPEELPPHYQNYYRQIPNKPPPPYIPPSSLPFSKFEKKNEAFSVIVNDAKEVQDIVTKMALALKNNITENIHQPNTEIIENGDLATKSQQLYKQFLCDLTKEMVLNLNRKAKEKPSPWMKTWKLTQKSFQQDNEKFINTVVEKTLQLLGLKDSSVESKKNESVMKLGRKKRDFVDNILIKELREEESSWVNYEQDEIFIKTELSDAIFDILVDDTVTIIGKLQQKV